MTAFISSLITEILGDKLTPVTLVATYVFAIVGIFIRWYFDTRKSIKVNPVTPRKFDFVYWLQNNLWKKIVSICAVFAIIFVLIRFPSDWGIEYVGYFGALLIGVFFDYFIDKINNKINDLKSKNLPPSEV